MTGCPTRVAVQIGSAALRVAGTQPGAEPWLVAELPADDPDEPAPGRLRALLAELFEQRPAELVVVHPATWAPDRVASWRHELAAAAGTVRTVPLAVAAAGDGAGAAVAVLHVGGRRTEAALVEGTDPWRVGAVAGIPVGGAVLDGVVLDLLVAARSTVLSTTPFSLAQARAVREAVSLLPHGTAGSGGEGQLRIDAEVVREALRVPLAPVVELLRTVLATAGPGRSPEVVVVGGLARTPLVLELIDAAGIAPARPADRPDAAAVLGALRLPASTWAQPADPGPAPPAVARPRLLPPARRRRHRPVRAAMLTAAVAAAVVALLAGGRQLARPVDRAPAPSGVLVQYGYLLRLPVGWEHSGGLPERRRSLLTPLRTPAGTDLISVEQTVLGYDADAEPARARAELRAEFDSEVAAGAALSGFDPAARLGDRPVIGYRQTTADGRAVVDWFVVLDGDAQLSVGCQHTTSGAAAVRSACETVVGSVRRS